MEKLKYQLKSIRRDKMCILTFLLPVVVGIVIHLLSGFSFQSGSYQHPFHTNDWGPANRKYDTNAYFGR